MAEFLDSFPNVITIPNILTEVSNLSGKFKGRTLERLRGIFAERLEVFDEEYVASRVATADGHFHKLGLTDAAIIRAALSRKCLVLTDDYQLAGILASRNIAVINFNWIRQRAWNVQGKRGL